MIGPLALAALLGAAPARAADPPSPASGQGPAPRAARLDYVRGLGTERCPGEQAFRDAVGAKVARDFFAAVPKPSARLVVTLGRRGVGYEGAAELHDAAGAVTWSMVFPGPPHPPAATCASLIAALAFGLAIEVDPVDAPPVDPPPPVVQAPIAPPPPPAKPEAPTWPFRIGASPWVDFATAPRVAVGLSLGLGFRVAWFSLDLEGRWDPPAASTIKGAEVGTSRVVAALVPCGHVRYFAGCLLAEVDSHRGTVSGAGVQESTHAAIYATIGGRLSAEIEIAPHLALRPAVDLLLPLQRPALYVHGVLRWEVPVVSGRVGLGLLASF
jgi:hypothetical protein